MSEPTVTLLIIDDDNVVRASLAAYLEDSGFRVLQAESGMRGLELFDSEAPDLVICDLRMPQMDGLELICLLTERHADLPVIIVSGAGVMADAVEALRLGASDYLIKPLEDLAVLEHSIYRALDRYRLRQENLRYRQQLEAANRELQSSLAMLEKDQAAGRQVQMSMLPPNDWKAEGFSMSYRIIPSLYLSGDFIDYLQLDERRIAFYLADVSGHGASSAFVTVLLKFMTTRLLYEHRRASGALPRFKPSQVLDHINRSLINCNLGKHVTMLGGILNLERNTLEYSVGGHLPLPVLYADGKARYLEGQGMAVGLFPQATYSDHVLELPDDFSLMLFSDGIFEILEEKNLIAKERCLPALVEQAEGSLESIEKLLKLSEVQNVPDDIALLVLSRKL